MKEIILIKNGELVLKGLNRNTFEDILVKNIKKSLKKFMGTILLWMSNRLKNIMP